MLTSPARNLTVVRYAEGWGFAAAEWERALARAGEPVCLKQFPDGSCRVWRTKLTLGHAEREVVIKLQPLRSWRKLIQSWLGLSQHARQWRGAERLAARGFRAARGRVLLRGENDAGPIELLVLESIPGRTVLEHLAGELTVRQQHALARALGRHAAAMANAGLTNRDSKPSNLIVEWKADTPTIAVVDTVAIRPVGRSTTHAGIVRTLRDFLLEPLGCGIEVRTPVMMRALRATAGQITGDSWKTHRDTTWRLVADRINQHGDPTPTDRPLGQG